MTICAAYFAVPEGVRFAVSQLPIAHCSLGDINKEGHTSCKDADEGGSDPARAVVEVGEDGISDTLLRMDRSVAEGIFDLYNVN